ncbi:MAG: Pvc16 family protein [Cyanobacteria bacterium P01_D01_bin.156]
MATTDALDAVCDAIAHILRTSMTEQSAELGLGGINPRFSVYQSGDFSNPDPTRAVSSGASVFLYRALPNLSHRTPSGAILPDGRQRHSKLPLDLYILITIWGESPSTQNRLVGWVMRTLEDYPLIPASVLNIGNSETPIFEEHETVELLLSEMNGDELLQLWDMLGGDGVFPYQVTIPYLVRNLFLESRRTMPVAEPVQVRTADMRRLVR